MSIAAIKLEFTPLQGEELLKWIPDFKADGRLTDPIKKEKDIKDKEEKWLADVGNHTFTTKLKGVKGFVKIIDQRTGLLTWSRISITDDNEERVYVELLSKINEHNITKLIWHNVDKYNLRLQLLSIKYQLKRIIQFEEVLFNDKTSFNNLGKNILLENLEKYFDIKVPNNIESDFIDANIVAIIHDLTI